MKRTTSPLREYQPELALSIIEAMKNKGWSQSEIARHFGVTRQAISYYVRKYGGMRTARQVILEDHYPFVVPTPMHDATQNRRLRDHAEFIATEGRGMDAEKIRRLASWYQLLRDNNWVVEFDPAIPPTPGTAAHGGWAYRTREPRDGKLLIRANEHTNLTKQGLKIWRFPPQDP